MTKKNKKGNRKSKERIVGNSINTVIDSLSTDEENEGKGRKKMFLMPILPIIISVAALIVSIYMAYLQYSYSQAEYEYKRDPVIGSPSFDIYVRENSSGDERFIMFKNVNIDIIEENNLERMYCISPNYEVVSLEGGDYTKEIKEYFNKAFESGEPDIKIGEDMYFYRFILFEGIDDDLELNLFYFKTRGLHGEEAVPISFIKIDRINLLQLKNGYPDDVDYEGERRMAKQYEEILNYYQNF